MILALVLPALLLSAASGSLDFYMDAAQTERLYGVSTAKGIYYIKDGIVNQYAMTFQDQVGNHYRVTHLVGKNLSLTWILDVSPSYLGSR